MSFDKLEQLSTTKCLGPEVAQCIGRTRNRHDSKVVRHRHTAKEIVAVSHNAKYMGT